jgi:hypothetical protein
MTGIQQKRLAALEIRLAALAALGLALPGTAFAESGNTVARWVQYAPGSSANALAAGTWGDAPTSLTNTILVRAVVKNAAACPAAYLDHNPSNSVTLNQRFIASQLTNVPGTSGATNGAAGYPQYFVSASATAPSTLPDGTAAATTSYGECEAVVPAGHHVITVDGVELKLPVANPKRILVMADTGCRLNGAIAPNGANQQNCHSPAAFPLSYLAPYEASFKPDAILQVGDWFYRDSNCTGGTGSATGGAEPFPGCNTITSPNYEVWGDTFDSWNADVFYPMKPLLAAAPLIAVRGNHESCGRGARGWFAFLSPYPLTGYNGAFPNPQPSQVTSTSVPGYIACTKTGTYPAPVNATTATYQGDFEPSYAVPLNGVDYLIQDDSFANDSKVDTAMAPNYDIDLSNMLAILGASTPVVYATHKPTFGLSYSYTGSTSTPGTGSCLYVKSGAVQTYDESGDWTQQAVFNGGTSANSAFVNGVPSNVFLFLSGHVHQFQYLNIAAAGTPSLGFAPQLIVGTGGSLLDPDCNTGAVPNGVTNVANFSQNAAPYKVQLNPGTSQSSVTASTFSHDEFGFAIFDKLADGSGYLADIYKVSSAKAGVCRVKFNPRSITCQAM